jgi:hypothetical protein
LLLLFQLAPSGTVGVLLFSIKLVNVAEVLVQGLAGAVTLFIRITFASGLPGTKSAIPGANLHITPNVA